MRLEKVLYSLQPVSEQLNCGSVPRTLHITISEADTLLQMAPASLCSVPTCCGPVLIVTRNKIRSCGGINRVHRFVHITSRSVLNMSHIRIF
jgi:hypothetical protein